MDKFNRTNNNLFADHLRRSQTFECTDSTSICHKMLKYCTTHVMHLKKYIDSINFHFPPTWCRKVIVVCRQSKRGLPRIAHWLQCFFVRNFVPFAKSSIIFVREPHRDRKSGPHAGLHLSPLLPRRSSPPLPHNPKAAHYLLQKLSSGLCDSPGQHSLPNDLFPLKTKKSTGLWAVWFQTIFYWGFQYSVF